MSQHHSRNHQKKRVVFTEAQQAMLQMSEEDIKYGRVISQEQLDAEDLKWFESFKRSRSC